MLHAASFVWNLRNLFVSSPVPAWLADAIATMGPGDVVQPPRGCSLSAQDALWLAEFLVEYEELLVAAGGH